MNENTPSPLGNVITIDDERIKSHLDRVVRGSAEETLNADESRRGPTQPNQKFEKLWTCVGAATIRSCLKSRASLELRTGSADNVQNLSHFRD
jgi:hypothetical protein